MSHNFEFLLPNLQKLKISVEGDKSLSAIEAEIKKEDKFRSVEFRTWDNSVIGKNNIVDAVFKNTEPIFIRVGTMEWQLLNFSDFDFNHAEKHKLKVDFSNEPNLDLQEITSLLKLFNQNKELSEEDLKRIAMSLYRIKHFNNSESASTSEYKNLEEIFKNFYDLKSEYTKLFEIKEKLLLNCQLKAKILILLAGILFILELAFIYWGTFIKYSWDIVEPVTYLLGCSNLILVLFFKRKMGNLTPLEFYTRKYFKRLVNKKKFDEIHFHEVKGKLKEIEIFLNK